MYEKIKISVKYEIDLVKYEIDLVKYEIDLVKYEIDSVKYEIDRVDYHWLVFLFKLQEWKIIFNDRNVLKS